MKRRQFIQLISLGGLATGLMLSPSVIAKRSPLVMGIFPRRNPKTTYRMFTPLARYLSDQLGTLVSLETTRDFPSFWENVQNQRYDLVHFNQYHYVVANKHYGYKAVAMNEENGLSTIASTITVRKDSDITSVEQLKGKKIIFGGGKRAMQSHIVAKWLLKKHGLDESEYVSTFARNPPNALLSVFNGQVDAAGSGDAVLKMQEVERVMDISQLQILVKSEPMAHLPWAVSDKIEPELFATIQSALTNLSQSPKGLEVLESAELTNIVSASNEDYTRAFEIIREVYGDTLVVDQP